MQRLAVLAWACLALGAEASWRGSAVGQAQARDDVPRVQQSWTVALPPERRLSVHVTVGDVRITGEARKDALIEVVRAAPRKDGLARIPVAVDETPGDVRVTATQAGHGTDAGYRTDITLRVPRESTLGSIRIMEGRLALTSFAGSIDADVRRGSVEASDVQGTIRIETGIGDIAASRARLSTGGLLRLRTFNGDIRLALAEMPRDARILALALNGTIESKIPLTTKDTWGPRWAETTIGAGTDVISLDVVTGRIEISIAR